MPKPNSSLGRMKHMLSTGDDADVHFLLGKGEEKEILPAHKLILKAASDVFGAMFRFDAENAKSAAVGTVIEPVEVPDVEVGAFKAMLSFIYADDLSGLNGDNAISVLYVANKYDVAELIKACVDFPIGKLSNVFDAFDKARFLGEEDFARRCLDYIDRNAETLLLSKAFFQIDQQLLCEILDRDQLFDCKEMAIWMAALIWADEQCRQNGKAPSAENRRAMLGPALFKIRFTLISQEQFSENIVPSGLLTDAELVSVYLHYSNSDAARREKYPLLFSTRQRATTKSPVDGPYKAKGKIMMTIEKASEFARWDVKSYQLGEAVYIRGLPWKILAFSRTVPNSAEKCLGFFVQCNAGNTDPSWRCAGSTTLRIVSQIEGKADHTRKIRHTFHSNENDWGFAQFMTFEALMDPDCGWYDANNDTVILSAEVTADEPTGVE